MKWIVLSLSVFLFASCSRFCVPHYRKLKLVPAQENSFTNDSICVVMTQAVQEQRLCTVVPISNNTDTLKPVGEIQTNGITTGRISHRYQEAKISANESVVYTPVGSRKDSPTPIRRDWSVLIAILLLLGGISLLLWSVAIFFAIPAAFWIRLLIGIGMIPLSIRMILLGTRILFNRWRNPSNYKESDH